MKKLLLLPVLFFSACAPILQGIQKETASLSRDGQTIVFQNPGPDVAEAPSLLLIGEGVSVTDTSCKVRASGNIGCTLPDTPAGQQYRITVAGKVKAGSISFYKKSSGARPIYLELP